MQYKTALLLHKAYNSETYNRNYGDLFFNQNFKEHSQNAYFLHNSTYKVGRNTLANRFYSLNNSTSFSWLNHEFDQFKSNVKSSCFNQRKLCVSVQV